MKRKGEIAMLFNDLEDSQLESVVGGFDPGFTAVGVNVDAFAVGDYATTISNTTAKVIDLPNNYRLGIALGTGFAISLSKNQ